MKPPTKRVPPTLSYRTTTPATATAGTDPEAIKNFYMPIWLLGGGVVIEMVAAFSRSSRPAEAVQLLGLNLIAGTVIMLVGLLVAVRFRGIQLGNFWTAVFKLAAISVAPAAAVDLTSMLLDHIPLGGLIAFVLDFVLYFALLGALFDLDESDTWYCVWVIFLIRLACYFGIAFIMTHH